MLSKDKEAMQPHVREFVDRAVTFTACPECGGTRLTEAARSSKIEGINIAEACAMQISDLTEWVGGLDEPSVTPLLAALQQSLHSFVEIGLGYLSLDRPSGTLSGGEAQRTKMIRQLGSSLTDVTYVFDEPTIGLHPHDIQLMNDLLLQLRDKGNTVLVVEHKPEAIAIANHVVDLGPGAGTTGGEVVFEGTVDGLRASGTLTGRHLDDRASLKPSVRTPSGVLEVRGASTHNLRDVDVDVPLGMLVVVTGVAGSGKSSLVQGSISGREGVVSIDQGAIRGSRRSNPATYTGLLDPIRNAFAKANGVKPALFSANSEGACPNCNGAGVIYTDLAMMAGVATTCEECEGKRFEASVLEYHLGGRDISEVLAMSVTEAREFFGTSEARTPAAHAILDRLGDVGLGYLSLGQPLTTLSGGERQRLKLATHMAEKGRAYVLDEPTTGLHLADVEQLLSLLDQLVDSGKSVIVIEHHQAVMAHADWIIDLGPGAGHDGGRIVFEGTPANLVAIPLHPHRRAPRGLRRHLTGGPRADARPQERPVVWRAYWMKTSTSLSAGERSRQTKPGQHAVLEAGHGADPVAGEGEHDEASRMADTARGMYVEPDCRLTVRAGRHEVVAAASAEKEGAEAGHHVAALVFEGHRRHGHEDVVGQQGHQRVEIGRFVRADKLGHERSLGRRPGPGWRRAVSAGRLTALQAGPRSLESAVDRLGGRVQHLGHLIRVESEDIA